MMGGPWEKYSGSTPAQASGPWDKYRDSPETEPSLQTPDWYVRSSDLRKKGYQATKPVDPDEDALVKRGFTPEEVARVKNAPSYVSGMFSKTDEYLGKGTSGGEELGSPKGRILSGATGALVGAESAAQDLAKFVPQAWLAQKGKNWLLGKARGKSGDDADLAAAVARFHEKLATESVPEDAPLRDVPVVGDVFRGAGSALVPTGASGKAGTLLAKAGRGAVQGLMGGAMAPIDAPLDQRGDQRMANMAGGTVVGGSIGAAGSLAGRPFQNKVSTLPPDVRPQSILKDLEGSLASKLDMDRQELGSIVKMGGTRAQAANRLLEEMTNAGDDVNRLQQVGAKIQKLKESVEFTTGYKALADIAGDDVKITTPKFVAALDKQIESLKRVWGNKEKPEIKELMEIRNDAANPEGGFHSYKDASDNLSVMKEKIRAIYDKSNTGSRKAPEAEAALAALREDLNEGFRTQKPGAKDIQDNLNERYRAYKTKWDSPVQDELLNTTEWDKLSGKMFGESADRARNVKASMSPSGQEAAKIRFVRDIIKAGTEQEGQIGEGALNPAAILKEINKRKASGDVLLEGVTLEQLRGLEKVLNVASKRSLQVGGTAAGAVAGGVIGGPIGAVSLGAVGSQVGGSNYVRGLPVTEKLAHGISKLLLTPSGQKMLLRASRLEPKSPGMAKLLEKLNRLGETSSRASGYGSALDDQDK